MTRLLDLFCGAGGAAVGYHRAGFEVVGVDIVPQPRYPFEFHQGDAMTYDWSGFDVIHASPPCQAYSAMSNSRPGLAAIYPALVNEVRVRLVAWGVPWVIENVPGSGLATASSLFGDHGVVLCGQMFGLDLYRHRHFESSEPLTQPFHPAHRKPTLAAGRWRPGTVMSVNGHIAPMSVAREAMGIDWMNRDELTEAIPPAFTEFLGLQLIHEREEA